jgi:hypothetical protein
MNPTPPALDPRHSPLDASSPWLGLASFTEESHALFHGRDGEIADLALRVRRKQLTVLFGQSGLGKTSLVRAGLVPALRPEGFCPVYLRLHYEPDAPPPAEQIKQEVLRATAVAGNWTRPGSARAGDGSLARAQSAESLWEFFHHRDNFLHDEVGQTLTPLLLCDQFEEIFTLAQSDNAGRIRARAFLAELADLVENRVPLALEQDETATERFDFNRADYRILIALREDYLAHLEGLRDLMPSITQNRVRLTRMSGAQALDVVLKPGAGLVGEEVARAIVRFVAGGAELERAEIEPSLLSLVCSELNEARLARGASEISADLLAGSRDTILSEFYERAVSDQPAGVRHFIEDHLLTDSGFRESVAEERVRRAFTDARAPSALGVLVDRRLLRIEERLDVRRIELTHDVLCPVVATSRETRHAREAQEAAARQLAASRTREQDTRRALWRARLVAMGAVALAVLAVAGAVFGWVNLHRAHEANALADTARGQAEELVDFMMTDLRSGLEDRGGLQLLRASTEAVIHYYETLSPELRSPETDRAHAAALEAMADIYSHVGESSEKARAWTEASTLRRSVAAARPDDADAAAALLRNESLLPYRVGDKIAVTDLSLRQQTIQRWRQLAARFPASPTVRKWFAFELAELSNDLASPLRGMYVPHAGLPPAREAYALAEQLAKEQRVDREVQGLRWMCMNILAQALLDDGLRRESLSLNEQVLKEVESAWRADPGSLRLRGLTAECYWTAAQAYEWVSLEKAVPFERKAREEFRFLRDQDPADRSLGGTAALTYKAEVTYLTWVACQIEPAREACRAWDAELKPFERRDYVRRLRWWISAFQISLASWAGDEDDARARVSEAIKRFDDYVAHLQKTGAPLRLPYLEYRQMMSRAYADLHAWSELESTSHRCLSEIAEGLDASPEDQDLLLSRRIARGYLGLALWHQGHADEAREALEEAHSGLGESSLNPLRMEIGRSLRRLVALDLGDLVASQGDMNRARDIFTTLASELQVPYEPTGVTWQEKELLAKTYLRLAMLLDPAQSVRRDEFLAGARAILESAEAEGRITVDGKQTKARIHRLWDAAGRPQ